MEKVLTQLKKVGLTKNEALIYLAIIEIGKTNVSSIANKTSINRRNIYDSLSTLLDKGLIFQIVGEKEGIYAGVNPDKLIELIQSKENTLDKIIIELEDIYQAKKVKDKATIYKGIEGFKNYLEDILDVGKDVYCLGAKGGWGNPALGEYGDWFIKERVRKKIKVYNLFDQSMKEKITGNKLLYDLLSERRFLHKDYSTDSAIDIFGDQVVTFTGLSPEKFEEDVTLFVMQSKDLAESWKVWFRFLWDNSK